MRLFAAVVVLCLVATLPIEISAALGPEDEPRISDFKIALQGRRVAASFALVNGFSNDLLERIHAGLPSGFDYRFSLVHHHRRWFDRELATAMLQVVAMYNAVTREYLINIKQDGKLVESRIVRDLGELRRAMTRIDNLILFNVEEVPSSMRLMVRTRAELGSRNLLSIVPTTVTTDWVESAKFRAPAR